VKLRPKYNQEEVATDRPPLETCDDAQQVVETLPAYQEFIRDRHDDTLPFEDI